MNCCFEGHCCCDAAEWEGDTYCDAYYGKTELVEVKNYVYYLDTEISPGYPIVLSVEPHECLEGTLYFRDPDLTIPIF